MKNFSKKEEIGSEFAKDTLRLQSCSQGSYYYATIKDHCASIFELSELQTSEMCVSMMVYLFM